MKDYMIQNKSQLCLYIKARMIKWLTNHKEVLLDKIRPFAQMLGRMAVHLKKVIFDLYEEMFEKIELRAEVCQL